MEQTEELTTLLPNADQAYGESLAKQFQDLALEYFGETEDNRTERIEDFQQLLQRKGPELLTDIPGNEEGFLLKFLRAGNFDIDKAYQVLKDYIQMITTGPQYFSPAFEKGLKEVNRGLTQNAFQILINRDKYLRRIVMWKPGLWNPLETTLGDFYSCGYTLMEIAALEEETQISGAVIICDATDFGLNQLRNIAIEDIKFLAMFLQGSFPLWFRGIHFINTTYFLSVGLKMLRQFLNTRVKNLIKVHNTIEDLHVDIERRILPKELGGNYNGTTKTLDNHRVLESGSKYLQELKKYVYRD